MVAHAFVFAWPYCALAHDQNIHMLGGFWAMAIHGPYRVISVPSLRTICPVFFAFDVAEFDHHVLVRLAVAAGK